jgi:hypothetical protein
MLSSWYSVQSISSSRIWSNTDFDDANFRVCLTMVASNSSRHFLLDWVGV